MTLLVVFIAGLFVGGFLGVLVMAIVVAGSRADRISRESYGGTDD